MKVYRYENSDNRGPFRKGCIGSAMPTPQQEGHFGMMEEEVCGCTGRRQLRRWFDTDDRNYIKYHGFGLAVYEIDPDHVEILNCQVLFNPRLATSRVSKIKLTN